MIYCTMSDYCPAPPEHGACGGTSVATLPRRHGPPAERSPGAYRAYPQVHAEANAAVFNGTCFYVSPTTVHSPFSHFFFWGFAMRVSNRSLLKCCSCVLYLPPLGLQPQRTCGTFVVPRLPLYNFRHPRYSGLALLDQPFYCHIGRTQRERQSRRTALMSRDTHSAN